MDTKQTASYNFPFFSILGLIFITLKLLGITEVATWSWWWVLAPIWLPLILLFVVVFIILFKAAMAD